MGDLRPKMTQKLRIAPQPFVQLQGHLNFGQANASLHMGGAMYRHRETPNLLALIRIPRTRSYIFDQERMCNRKAYHKWKTCGHGRLEVRAARRIS